MKKRKHSLQVFILIICSSIFFLPVILLIFNTFKPTQELFSSELSFLPKNPTLSNYINAFKTGDFKLYFFNSFFVSSISTVLSVFVNSMAGYALAKFNFKGKKLLFILFISVIMIPLEVVMSSVFKVIVMTGLFDSLWGLIIPAIASPTGLFMMRQYMLSIPDELIKSSRIDGCSEFQIFLKIIMPMARPAWSALAIFSFMWRWNDFLWPLIVVSSPKNYTLQLAISNYAGEFTIKWESLLAMSVISIIPMLIIFLIFQKQFVQGISSTGMK